MPPTSSAPKPVLAIVREDEGYRVTVSVTNDSAAEIDPGVRSSTMLIDGTASFAWSFAAMNGAGERAERHLAPGATVSLARVLPGQAFGGAGRHECVAVIGDEHSDAVSVDVTD